MTLYFIRSEIWNGDAAGPINLDLFVKADSPSEAVKSWNEWYWGDVTEDKPKTVTVYPIYQDGFIRGPISWDMLDAVMVGT